MPLTFEFSRGSALVRLQAEDLVSAQQKLVALGCSGFRLRGVQEVLHTFEYAVQQDPRSIAKLTVRVDAVSQEAADDFVTQQYQGREHTLVLVHWHGLPER